MKNIPDIKGQALSALDNQEYDNAEELFSLLLDEEDPIVASDVRTGLGIAKLKRDNDLSKASLFFEEAILENPNNYHAHFYLATIQEEREELDLAIKGYLEALRLSPNHKAAKSKLSKLLPRHQTPVLIQKIERPGEELQLENSLVYQPSNFMQVLLDHGTPNELRAYYLIKSNEFEIRPSIWTHLDWILVRWILFGGGYSLYTWITDSHFSFLWLVLISLIVLAWVSLEVNAKTYIIKDGMLRRKIGLFNKEDVLIELYRIRSIKTWQNPLDTLLGYCTLIVEFRLASPTGYHTVDFKGICTTKEKETLLPNLREMIISMGLSPVVRIISGI